MYLDEKDSLKLSIRDFSPALVKFWKSVVSKGDIVIDTTESEIVKYIFKKHNDLLKNPNLTKTKKTQRLLKLLKSKGYSFRGKHFNWWNVKHILSNPFYVGILKWKNKTTNHSYGSIISKRLFNQVQPKVCIQQELSLYYNVKQKKE